MKKRLFLFENIRTKKRVFKDLSNNKLYTIIMYTKYFNMHNVYTRAYYFDNLDGKCTKPTHYIGQFKSFWYNSEDNAIKALRRRFKPHKITLIKE